ncbi:MAG: glycosyltransferase, partial [Rubrivivax sp.]
MLPPPAADLRAVVVMPVRNEAAGIDVALLALASQVDATGQPLDRTTYEIIVLANNCDDDTAQRAHRFAAAHPALALHVLEARLPPELAHVGHARGCLFDAACERLHATAGPRGFIASTDGDTRVDPHWLQATRDAFDGGADAVGGRILTDEQPVLSQAARRLQRIDGCHALLRSRLEDLIDPDANDPWPRHHQHFGASLAVAAGAYRAAGGMPAVECLEDMALVRMLQRTDHRLRHAPTVRVTTSSRL